MAHAKDRYTVFIEDLKASQERVTNTVTKDLLIIAGRVSISFETLESLCPYGTPVITGEVLSGN